MTDSFSQDRQFQRILAGAPAVDMAELLLEFSRDAHPNVDIPAELARVDHLAKQVQSVPQPLCDNLPDRDKLAQVSHTLYAELGFQGNEESFHDPANTYLNEVLSRRKGIPISLGILYWAVAERCGVLMYGVCTPGHFLLGFDDRGGPAFIDPFCEGRFLTMESSRALLRQIVGDETAIRDEQFLPASPKAIAARVLRNLKIAYAQANAWAPLLPVQKRLFLLCPECLDEMRDLGLICLRNQLPGAAVQWLTQYRNLAPQASGDEVRDHLKSAQRMLASSN